MALFHQLDLMHAVAGLLVGLLVGLTGVGGGSLMTPLLVLLFGVNPGTAVGTDLLYASATKTVGTSVHGWRDTVDWGIFARLVSGSLPAALITIYVLNREGPLSRAAQNGMMTGLAVMLAITAVIVIFQKRIIAYAGRQTRAIAARPALPTIVLGALLGAAVSATSVGAGAIGVTALLLLYPGLPVARIVGTDIAHAVPLTLVAGIGHWIYGDVNAVLLVNLLIGSVPGIIVGSLIASRSPDVVLRPLLGVVLIISASQLYAKGRHGDGHHAPATPPAAASASRAS